MGAGAKRKANASSNKDVNTAFTNVTKSDDLSNNRTVIKPKVGVLNYLDKIARGNLSISSAIEFKKTAIMGHINRYTIGRAISFCDRRITSMEWHPMYSHIFVAGTKAGTLFLRNLNDSTDHFFPDMGARGAVLGLKFQRDDPYAVYTATITGKISEEDFRGKTSKTLLSTLSWTTWFSCLDVDYKRKILMTGDSAGYGYILATSGPPVWQTKAKLHKAKINHCAFNQHDENIFVTASNDHSVKLWDLRSILGGTRGPQPLCEFQHEKPVSSACFSTSNSLSLLTTDDYDQLRVYSSPLWDETLTIKHPHRHGSHNITPIKATWHPLEDIIIVGRHPSDDFLEYDHRSIDFYDGTNGELLQRINSPTGQIVSLNGVNTSGDTIASVAGLNVVLLKDEYDIRGYDDGTDDCTDDGLRLTTKRVMPERKRIYTNKNPQKAV